LSPIAASENSKKGIRIAENQYWLPTSGITTKAITSMVAITIRSWRIGKIC